MKPRLLTVLLFFVSACGALAQSNVPPAITMQPDSQTLIVGDTLLLVVQASGTDPQAYLWRKNSTTIAGWPTDRNYFQDVYSVSADAGNYSVIVTNAFGRATTDVAVVTVYTPPTFTQQPVSKTSVIGTTLTLSVKATGTAPITCQWFSPLAVPIPGATSTNLVLTNVQPADAGDYIAVIDNPATPISGSVSSDPATLTVIVPPTVTTQPESDEVVEGFDALFFVDADGSDPLTYQWRKNGTTILGETDSLLYLTVVDYTDVADYTCVIANAAGSVTSAAAHLAVDIPPEFTLQPLGKTAQSNTVVTLTVHVSGTTPMGYQWMFNDDPIPGATNSSSADFISTYSFTVTNVIQTGRYSVVASNIADDASSVDAYVFAQIETVAPACAISTPANNSVTTNPVITVSGVASDNISLAYVQFEANGGTPTYCAGTTNWTCTFPAIAGTNDFIAYAHDTSGNKSLNQHLKIHYSVPVPVKVITNGVGSTFTNYGGQKLDIGRNYVITATNAGAGFVFTNWTGGTNLPFAVLTNSAALKFSMRSNLTVQANFRDIQNPVLAITNGLPGGLFPSDSASANVRGTAADNWMVASVFYKLNNGPWLAASGSNSWTAPVTLAAGTNVLSVYSVDAGGNKSATNTTSSVVALLDPFSLSIAQSGSTALVSFPSAAGVAYNLEFKNALDDPAWTSLTNSVTGDGGIRTLDDTSAPASGRTYRIRATLAP